MSESLSIFLRKARIRKRLSQRDVADLLGYESAQFVSNWERGVSLPPIKILGELAKVYGISKERLESIYVKRYVVKLKEASR